MQEDDPSEGEGRTKTRKQVTVNDEPEVFHIRPDTVEVEKQERPIRVVDTTSIEHPSEYVDNIIHETADIIKFCEEKVLSQKLNNAKLGFMLIRIAESLKSYENCIKQLDNFLINGEEITARYYIYVCGILPPYGDYLKVIEDVTDSTVTVQGVKNPVAKVDLENFVREIQENAHAGGMFLKTFRVMIKDINQYMQERKEITEQINKQMGIWLNLKNAVVDQLDAMRDSLFKLSAYLDFVKTGETKIRPAHDISSFNFSSSFGNSSLNSRNNNRVTFDESFGSVSNIEKST